MLTSPGSAIGTARKCSREAYSKSFLSTDPASSLVVCFLYHREEEKDSLIPKYCCLCRNLKKNFVFEFQWNKPDLTYYYLWVGLIGVLLEILKACHATGLTYYLWVGLVGVLLLEILKAFHANLDQQKKEFEAENHLVSLILIWTRSNHEGGARGSGYVFLGVQWLVLLIFKVVNVKD